jgi:hypothetical protein
VTDEVELTIRFGLLAVLLTLLMAMPKEASSSRSRNALAAFLLPTLCREKATEATHQREKEDDVPSVA